MEKVLIFDTTLRDGEQSPGFSMNLNEKLRVAKQLEKMKIDIIEAGYPRASEGDFEAVREIAKIVRDAQITAIARTDPDDIDCAWEAIKGAAHPRIHTFVSTSDIHLNHQLLKSKEEVLEIAKTAVKRASSYTSEVEFSTMDATRSDRDFLCQIIKTAIGAGATTVNIPDTVGYALPLEYGELIKYISEHVPNIHKAVISAHCHNDLGLAVANSLSAVQNGARQVECAINGIGERAGNASLEEVVMTFRTRRDYLKLDTNVVSEQIYPTSRLLSHITGVFVQPNKAIVGDNAFAHESGIHQDGILKEKLTYEIITPESIGVAHTSLVLGKHSGRHALRERLKDLGYEMNKEDLNQAFSRFKELADKKKDIFDEDLEAIVADEVLRIPDKYKLIYINVVSGSVTVPTATVQLELEGKIIQEAGFGDGPVDAAFKTIAKITDTKSKLLSYSVDSITGGTDAQGKVTVKLEEEDYTVMGQGAHTDIITASARAYVNALNRLAYLKKSPEKAIKDAV